MPLDGKEIEGQLTKTTVHRAGPQMYYVAIMDCDDNVSTILTEGNGRVEVKTHLTEGENEFSYEKQGIIKIDVFLLLIYIVVFALNY